MSDAPMIELPLSSLMARLPDGFALRPCTRAAWWDAFEALPPRGVHRAGFLLGEPYDHRTCGVTGELRASYSVYVGSGDEGADHWSGTQALTLPEWQMIRRRPDALHEAINRGSAA